MINQDGKLALQHLVTMETLSNEEVMALVENAQEYKKTNPSAQSLKEEFVANMFFESSTRTHKSFEVAERRLGYKVVDFDASTSSVNKGETLYDTVLTMSAIGIDVCVIRHPQDSYYEELIASPTIKSSIVNGGDGSGQHPSQCLLDLMTIYEEFGHFNGLKIAIAGDLSHSRVAKSNMIMLKRLGAELYFIAPDEWHTDEFDEYGKHVQLDDIIEELDVLMLLRVQHERHHGSEEFSEAKYNKEFGLTHERYDRLKDAAIIMHPAPVNRGVEIDDDLVESPKSRIVEQMTNGVYVRMAILDAIMNYRNQQKLDEENK
ncbi:aspartate carbamoyltransferase [Floricoccus penangensis]|uniref:Aspartate carbamoyltransferase n=1 Tax=Floricoccus penangensis TaxID=1859475 RepID=A0A9Q5P156_9LACT|nr:aspartate carbamoyltransferase catalytic subunit [Floricoccus penangensis]OFI47727.1 aspartate carbamoyltransferase [Floricoccus penangensis]